MADQLFNETFFKKNNYFKKELGLQREQISEYLRLILNWQKNCQSFNPDTDKETTDENEFVDILFKKILGFSGKGKDAENYSILPKFKIEGASSTGKAGFADLALGYFSKNKAEAEVVLEFKGQTSDDLTKLSNRPDKLSPVDQCWKYLLNHSSAKWGIVTNFNEIRIYNKEKGQNVYETFYFVVPPEYKDKFHPLSTETELLKLITILKKENLLSVNGISHSEELLKNKGTEETKVQKDFYLEYKSLRSQIFYESLKYNSQYESEKPKSELLQLVQKFLDRIIFCWFCEDSREHLIPSNVLSAELIQSQIKDKYYNPQHFSIYGKVKDLFQAIDEGRAFGIEKGYNGELFKPDPTLDALKLPNFLFEKISEIGMKYDFGDENELNVNILGHIFEQSISDLEEMRVSFQEYSQTPKKIDKQQVLGLEREVDVLEHKLEEFDSKKTKRKKEGVYYTPDYITNYIVENTVGEWLKEKWQEVEKRNANLKKNKEYKNLIDYREEYLTKIKILDPACGSGAFLIAAFNFLWKEHERVYKEIKEIKSKTAQGELFDFDSINRTILENNLYGVDLNRESVEITKLALWLKTAAKNKKLNSLHNNIKCGNSLIDDPSVAGDLAFDWKKEFPDIMNPSTGTGTGGFDVVIGNPPWVDIKGLPPDLVKHLFKIYSTAENRINLYSIFIEKASTIINNLGYFSFIIPSSLLMNESYTKIRKILIKQKIIQIIKLPDHVFENVNMESMIIITKNQKPDNYSQVKTRIYGNIDSISAIQFPRNKINQSIWIDNNLFNIYTNQNKDEVIKNIERNSKPLLGFVDFSLGITPYDKYKGHDEETIKGRKFHSIIKIDANYKPLIDGSQIGRYYIESGVYSEYIKYGDWLGAMREERFFINPHLVIRQIVNPRIYCGYSEGNQYNTQIGFNLVQISKIELKYLLVILNSQLISFYHKEKYLDQTKTVFQKILIANAKEFPIKEISLEDQTPFIQLADIMLTKNKELQEIQKKFIILLQTEFKIEKLSEKLDEWYLLDWSGFIGELKKKKISLSGKVEENWLERFERLRKEALAIKSIIDSTDKEIDKKVYELYGLTDDEIQIVEGEK